jgi:ketosteroid isomerase-like protein
MSRISLLTANIIKCGCIALNSNQNKSISRNMSPFEIAKKWLQAFNQHNLQNLLALYDDNAVHFSPKLKLRKPETNGLIKGKSSMKAWWQDAFDHLPDLTYRELSITANNERAFMEYERIVSGEKNIPVAEVLEIKNGLISASRVYHG